jgi:hypothetical protein
MATGWTGFSASHYAKVEHGGRDQIRDTAPVP